MRADFSPACAALALQGQACRRGERREGLCARAHGRLRTCARGLAGHATSHAHAREPLSSETSSGVGARCSARQGFQHSGGAAAARMGAAWASAPQTQPRMPFASSLALGPAMALPHRVCPPALWRKRCTSDAPSRNGFVSHASSDRRIASEQAYVQARDGLFAQRCACARASRSVQQLHAMQKALLQSLASPVGARPAPLFASSHTSSAPEEQHSTWRGPMLMRGY